jgi:hypothetical protein
MPADWQGFWLPVARLFVSPSGMEGIVVSGGVRDLWVGIGVHAGVTGIFEAEVVDRVSLAESLHYSPSSKKGCMGDFPTGGCCRP